MVTTRYVGIIRFGEHRTDIGIETHYHLKVCSDDGDRSLINMAQQDEI